MNLQHLGKTSLIALVALALSGCAGGKKSGPTVLNQSTHADSKDGVISAVQMDSPEGGPKDAQPNVPIVFQLVCYQLTIPAGTVSRNEDFWKRIDENVLSPGAYDLLRRNGMRIGEAPVSDLESLRNMLQEVDGSGKQMGTIGADVKNVELTMRKEVPFETVNYYGRNNELSGRTFDKSENIFNISYRRTPRKLDQMRLSLVPMVRSMKKRLEYTAKNDEIEISYIAPVKFYMDITVDLPMDKFLVLAPSDTSELPTIIGHQFFIQDQAAEQMETVLIFLAQPFRIDEPKQ
jgi:hypothetical protein